MFEILLVYKIKKEVINGVNKEAAVYVKRLRK